MKSTLQQAWRSRGLLACALWPVAQLYGWLTSIRRGLYVSGLFKVESVSVPVVVVGNVTVGGGGKTPLVIALMAHFARQGIRAGVVSRGYGRNGKGCLEVFPNTPVLMSGDEPALIKRAQAAPIFVANNRVEAARKLLAAYPQTEVIVCDDGLQHERMQRTVNVVVFDNTGLGNGWLLPAGPLRQHWPLPCQNAQTLVLHTGSNAAFAGFKSRRKLGDAAIGVAGEQVTLQSLAAIMNPPVTIVAMAGIAHPDAFFDMLDAHGLQLARRLRFEDHADYSRLDLASLKLPTEASITILCTEKDAIKLFELPQDPAVRVLAVPLVFTPEAEFFTALEHALNSRRL